MGEIKFNNDIIEGTKSFLQKEIDQHFNQEYIEGIISELIKNSAKSVVESIVNNLFGLKWDKWDRCWVIDLNKEGKKRGILSKIEKELEESVEREFKRTDVKNIKLSKTAIKNVQKEYRDSLKWKLESVVKDVATEVAREQYEKFLNMNLAPKTMSREDIKLIAERAGFKVEDPEESNK